MNLISYFDVLESFLIKCLLSQDFAQPHQGQIACLKSFSDNGLFRLFSFANRRQKVFLMPFRIRVCVWKKYISYEVDTASRYGENLPIPFNL